jgi:hypothetical protein
MLSGPKAVVLFFARLTILVQYGGLAGSETKVFQVPTQSRRTGQKCLYRVLYLLKRMLAGRVARAGRGIGTTAAKHSSRCLSSSAADADALTPEGAVEFLRSGGFKGNLYTQTYTLPISWRTQDSLGHVNNAQVLTYFEDQRNDRFYRHGIVMDSALVDEGPILAETRVRFRGPATYPGKLITMHVVQAG